MGFVITDGTQWFAGNIDLVTREPICDSRRKDAMELSQSEIDKEWPNGLPEGWTQMQA